jgi:hypothetical protein
VPNLLSAALIDGIRSDHTEAAIMTPAAKPRMMAFVLLGISRLKKYTNAEPAVVARKIMVKPMMTICDMANFVAAYNNARSNSAGHKHYCLVAKII